MNVDDIKDDLVPTNFSEMDMLDWIFHRQHELMQKYIPIEKHNGLCWTDDCPVNLNDKFGQARLKDFFWRTTEELTEAMEATLEHPNNSNHYLEELADALHFMVEALLLAGVTPNEVVQCVEGCASDKLEKIQLSVETEHTGPEERVQDLYWTIHHLGCAGNCLKQRPWKITHQLVDRERFYGHLHNGFWIMVRLFTREGLKAKQIFAIYFKKSEVNKFRQRSNY